MTAPTAMQIPGFRGDLITPDHHDYDGARAVWNGTVDRRPRLIARCRGTPTWPQRCASPATATSRSPYEAEATTSPAPPCATAGSSSTCRRCAPCRSILSSARPASRVAPCGATSTTRPRPTVWPPRRHREPHRRRRRQPGRRHRLAHAQARAHRRQPRGSRGGGRERRHRAGVGQRPPRPVLGPAGRWRKLRRRQLVPVRAAPRRPHRHGRTGVLGGRGHHRVLRFYRDFAADAPDELGTIVRLGTIPPLPVVDNELHFRPAIAVASCYAGPVEDGERAVRPLRQFGTPLVDLVGPTLYVDHQSGIDDTVPHGWHYYWKATNLTRCPTRRSSTWAAQSLERLGAPRPTRNAMWITT